MGSSHFVGLETACLAPCTPLVSRQTQRLFLEAFAALKGSSCVTEVPVVHLMLCGSQTLREWGERRRERRFDCQKP